MFNNKILIGQKRNDNENYKVLIALPQSDDFSIRLSI